MSVRVTQIREALAALLATINGTGSYTINLSATDAVKYGLPPVEGAHAQSAWISNAGVRKEREGADLTSWLWRASFRVVVFVTSDDTAAARLTAIEQALADIHTAIEVDVTLGGLAYDTSASMEEPGLQSFDSQGFCYGQFLVECWWLAGGSS